MSNQLALFVPATARDQGPTLAEARTAHAATLATAGEATCPCCDHVTRIYERRLCRAWMLVLDRLYQADNEHEGQWVLLDNQHAQGPALARDWSLMRFWSLIERHPEQAARYRITETGRVFREGHRTLPATARIVNNRLLGMGSEFVTYEAVRAETRAPRRAA